VNDRNIGRFWLDEHVIRNEPEKAIAIFAMLKCVPVQAESIFADRVVEYVAISDRFRNIPLGEPVPDYALTIETDDSGWPCLVTVTEY